MNKPLIVIDQPDKNARYDTIYAVIGVDADGNEGLAAGWTPIGWMPLVTNAWDKIELIRQKGAELAKARPGMRLILRKFENATDLETL